MESINSPLVKKIQEMLELTDRAHVAAENRRRAAETKESQEREARKVFRFISERRRISMCAEQGGSARRERDIRDQRKRRADQDQQNARAIEAAIAASKNPATSEFGHLGAGASIDRLTPIGLAAQIHAAAELARTGGHPLPEPTGLAKKILSAGKMARGETAKESEPPPADSQAAKILAAGRKARGETTIEPEPPPADSLAAKILAAGRKARGE